MKALYTVQIFYRPLLIGWICCASIFSALALRSQEIKSFSLPNGLEIQARHLANTGVVHARLEFSWDEGTVRTPLGTAWIMHKALPALGCNGAERDAFQSQKDQDGVISSISAGRGWIAWDFYSAPANADLMIQLLADESLRPLWPGGEQLTALLKKIWEESHFMDIREEAAHFFKDAAKDRNLAQLPNAPVGHNQFIALWGANVQRPTRAVLRVSGDIESISLLRLANQHFGPWAGIRSSSAKEAEAQPRTQRQFSGPGVPTNIDSAVPVLWIAVGGFASASGEMAVKALLPWLAKAGLPSSDAAISSWEASPEGSWLKAVGWAGRPMDELHSHFLSLLHQLATEKTIGKALSALADSETTSLLYPAKAFDELETANALGERDPEDLIKTLLEVKWDWLTYKQWR
jgi:hypothetical protein